MESDIVKLAQLLNPKKSEISDSEDEIELEKPADSAPTPADIGPRNPNIYDKCSTNEKETRIEVEEDEDKLYFADEDGAVSDWRKTPHWEASYKQQVTPSDVFLQMSARTPATSSCEDMILKIYLPEENQASIDLKITKDNIKLLSSKFRLDMPLPHPVNPQCGNAQWNKDSEQLIITLRMDREFDFANF